MGNENRGSARNIVQVGALRGDVHIHEAVGAQPVAPGELPAAPAHFVDRDGPLAELDELLGESREGRAAWAVISGVSGVGKSAFAVHWSHLVKRGFEDGQIVFDFRRGARDLGDAAEHCLRSLGVEAELIPPATDDKVAMLRSWTQDRKLLFLFDDVVELEDVLELLPASGASVVLCTSRQDGAELAADGALPIRLKPLNSGHALDCLRRKDLRERVDAEPDAAAELVARSGGLPIALNVMIGLLARRTSWTIARAVRELSERSRRRTHFRRAFAELDLAVEQLTRAEARVYGLLGRVGLALPAGAVAALADLTEIDAEAHLDELHRICLVEENDQEQFLLHDLVTEHAAETLGASDASSDDAVRRLVAWYRQQGAFADRMVTEPSRLRVVDDEVTGENPFTREEALEWLRSERVNLLGMVRLAAESAWHVDVIALCDGPLWALHNQDKHYSDTLSALAEAVTSAVAIEDLPAEARMRSLRGQLLVECGELDEALAECAEAVAVAERAGHRRILASALEFQGKALHALERFGAAIENFRRARQLNAELGRQRGMAIQDYLIGKSLSALGRNEEALQAFGSATELIAGFPGDKRTPSRISVAAARVHQALGQHEQAASQLREAISATRERSSFDVAEPLELLADSLTALGRPGARECLEEALEIYEQARSPKAERVRRKLSEG
ncbi:NB-ARC domain-containing protein [Saccharopolyspora antimicrobica]|uniref:NB-ARC domain-containing protein n=1 Tax=Saccharopolyspora antimicrobica TaxID=455193 RepID=A0A1I5EYG0_9PSEU|nr:tetratricopeptide repeat protein [Saccharopolyspora antimicrobica]RKT83597.1 NB-ARC domain-containing protein [Saccharopolyspora antimicrobica]SFO16507.1 NB-ARC domain-containing protein [Saccharopolyspora antimicrobica]